ERAVGMHYGGPGAAWDVPVGTSGLSPAGYSADVLARAQKYADAEPTGAVRLGSPSAPFGAEAPPPAALRPTGTIPPSATVPVMQLPTPSTTLPPPPGTAGGVV